MFSHPGPRLIDPTNLNTAQAKWLHHNFCERICFLGTQIKKGEVYFLFQHKNDIEARIKTIFTHDIIPRINASGDEYFEIVSHRRVEDERPYWPDFLNAYLMLGCLDLHGFQEYETLVYNPNINEVFVVVAVIEPNNMEEAELSFFARLLTEIRMTNGTMYFGAGDSQFPLHSEESGETFYVYLTLSRPLVCYEKKDGSFAFEILGPPLDSGGFGEVFQGLGAVSPVGDGRFKLKAPSHTVKKSMHDISKRHRDAFYEHSMVLRTQHLHGKLPSIVKIGPNQYVSYRVERRMHDESLMNIIEGERNHKRNILPTTQRLELTIALLRALKEQVYDNGIIHRDIKPDNMIVSLNSMGVFTIDFNLSEPEGDLLKKPGGTRFFMAPEVHTHGIGDHATDMYAMGITVGIFWGLYVPVLDDYKDAYSYACNHRTTGLFSDIDCSLNESHRAEFRRLFRKMIHPQRAKRYSLSHAINDLDRIWLERKLESLPSAIHAEIRFAHHHAIRTRDMIYSLQRDHCDEYVDVANVGLLVASIHREVNALTDVPVAVQEFVQVLGVKAFAGVDKKDDLFRILKSIEVRFKHQVASFDLVKNFENSGSLRLDAAVEKVRTKYRKALLSIDDLDRLMLKVDIKLSDEIHPAITKMLRHGRPEAAYNVDTPSLVRG